MIRCTCGEQLVGREAICENCSVSRSAPLRTIAGHLGLVRAGVEDIICAIDEIVAQRDRLEAIETEYCGELELRAFLEQKDALIESSFTAGFEGGITQGIAAVANDYQERQPSAMWSGMRRAIAVLEMVRVGKYEFVKEDDAECPL